MNIDIDKYIIDRVDNQIEWYDNKSSKCQKKYKAFQITEIILAAAVPLLSGYTSVHWTIPIIIGIIGIIITVLESISKLNKYHEYWIEYRSTCEMLRYHKNLYLTHSGPYCESEESIENLFVRNMEQIISSENNQWKSLNEKNNNSSDKNDDHNGS